ncbi:hypothetical protein K0M31_009237 [Melipona bicolor]|uniref:Uncharacterized protein n=1 Tax=Melipona bicolor TaxID=60889 RepID=A0AA40FPU9_9HYME|nr:hypothetical protein K0M31_009237 [Melipona bicolor]
MKRRRDSSVAAALAQEESPLAGFVSTKRTEPFNLAWVASRIESSCVACAGLIKSSPIFTDSPPSFTVYNEARSRETWINEIPNEHGRRNSAKNTEVSEFLRSSGRRMKEERHRC